MRKLTILVFLLAVIHFFAKANDSILFIKSIPISCKLMTTDPVGNMYLVKDDNTLLKYNAKGDSIGLFNEIKKGTITHLDATNPLRLLVYFADYSQIVILDNLLSIKSILKLTQLGLQNVKCVATSIDGKVWVYDPTETRLLKIDDKLNIQFSNTLRNVTPLVLDPAFMVEQNRSLYLVDSAQGIQKFDLFGFYMSSYDFKTKEIQCFNSDMVYTSLPYLYSYNTQSIIEKKLLLPSAENILQVRVERNHVYIRRSQTVDIYNISE